MTGPACCCGAKLAWQCCRQQHGVKFRATNLRTGEQIGDLESPCTPGDAICGLGPSAVCRAPSEGAPNLENHPGAKWGQKRRKVEKKSKFSKKKL